MNSLIVVKPNWFFYPESFVELG